MPEIAEVRTVAKTLNKEIVGKEIIGIDIIYDKIIASDLKAFKEVIGLTITKVASYGKWLLFELADKTILSHLRMEGKFFIKNSHNPIEKHEHIIFHLNNDIDLRYHDTRKFGKMMLVDTKDVFMTKEISKLGIEPDDNRLTKEYLYSQIKTKNKPVKSILLDQTIINGLGNIYVDEVLFASKIHPLTKGKTLTLSDCDNIRKTSKNIITKATELKGTTIRSYTSSLGVYGSYQKELKVHTREGEKCYRCEDTIVKTVVGGRGTYYCPTCQKQI